MNQDRAQILFREGATFVFLDVPERTEFGIDYNTWNVGPKFRGVKMIPPGVHFIYYSSVDKAGQVGPRTGFFYNFKQREVVVRKWDKYLEDIKPDVVPDEEVEAFRSNKKQMDEYLGAYPYESYKKWLSLTKHISTELLSRLMPECGRISSVTEFIPIAHRTTRRRHDELETTEGTGSASSDQDKPGLPSEQIDNVSIDKGDVCHVSADDTVMDDVLVQLCEKRKSPQNNRSGSNPDIDAKKSKVGSVSIPVGSHCFAWERVPVNSEETSPVKPDISDNKKIINDDTEVREDKFCVSLSDLNTDNANKTLQTNNEELCPCVAVDQEPVESMDVDMIQSASENTENIHSGSSSGKSDLSKIEQKLPIMQEQMATRIRFTEIPKQRFPHDASPSEITKYNMDTSYVLQQMLVNNYSDQYSGILGEIQFAFVCFIIGQVYNAFDQWKHLVHVLCSSDDALSTDTELFMQLIGVLHFQIEVIPEDFFVDIVTKNNFLTITLQEFFSNLETGTNIDKLLKNRGLKFREHLTQKFDWDFIAEPDDYAPVVVELTS